MAAPDCPRAGKWFGGCAFVDHYDETATGASAAELAALDELCLFSDDIVGAIRVLTATTRTYVCSVCATCGRTLQRPRGSDGA